MKAMKMLIIEDDDRLALPLKENFERQYFLVELAFDGRKGLDLGLKSYFDVILLDLMLPEMDGITVCQKLREAGCKAAIVMLTARDKTSNKIMGLNCGADDYLAKPFELEELQARIRAVMRRGTDHRQPLLTRGELSIDQNSCIVTNNQKLVELTATEYRLLVLFLSSPGHLFTKDELLNKLWSGDDIPSEQVIKTHIKGLRKNLDAAGVARNLIETVYGLGYRLNENA